MKRITQAILLALLAFLGEPASGEEGSHLDGNRTNNRLDNLVWESRSRNSCRKFEHGTFPCGQSHKRSKLTEEQVYQIRSLYPSLTQKQLGERFGVTQTLISAIVRGRIWRHL